jgi:hypothetical protein
MADLYMKFSPAQFSEFQQLVKASTSRTEKHYVSLALNVLRGGVCSEPEDDTETSLNADEMQELDESDHKDAESSGSESVRTDPDSVDDDSDYKDDTNPVAKLSSNKQVRTIRVHKTPLWGRSDEVDDEGNETESDDAEDAGTYPDVTDDGDSRTVQATNASHAGAKKRPPPAVARCVAFADANSARSSSTATRRVVASLPATARPRPLAARPAGIAARWGRELPLRSGANGTMVRPASSGLPRSTVRGGTRMMTRPRQNQETGSRKRCKTE